MNIPVELDGITVFVKVDETTIWYGKITKVYLPLTANAVGKETAVYVECPDFITTPPNGDYDDASGVWYTLDKITSWVNEKE